MRMWVAFVMLSVTTPVCAQEFGSTSGASSAINISNPASTTSKNLLITPPTVVAPGLAAAGIETCLGSTSGGISLMGAGFSLGSTMVDEGCTVRLLARQLFAFGFQKAALALMCQDERVAVAMETAGSPCPAAAFGETRELSRHGSTRSTAEARAAFAESREGSPVSTSPLKPVTQEELALFARTSD